MFAAPHAAGAGVFHRVLRDYVQLVPHRRRGHRGPGRERRGPPVQGQNQHVGSERVLCVFGVPVYCLRHFHLRAREEPE